jgi:hypothetical protein
LPTAAVSVSSDEQDVKHIRTIRRAVALAVACGIAAGSGIARAENSGTFLKQLIIDPGELFSGERPRAAKSRASAAPATAPMPRLRPTVDAIATVQAPVSDQPAATMPPAAEPAPPLLSYQPQRDTPDEDDAPDDAAEGASIPMPHLRRAAAAAAVNDVAAAAGDRLAAPPANPATKPTAKSNVVVASLPDLPLPKLKRPPPAANSTCGVALASLGVALAPLPPIEEGECGIEEPVAVSSLDGGAVDFTAKATVGCDTAETIANFVRKTVEPAAQRAFGEQLTGLRIAASYACRNRDNLPDAKLSEHAHGNAIDISGFRIGDRWIEVESGWKAGGKDADFLKLVRKAACGPFTTVLGPGEPYHDDHFHLDTIRRGKHGRALYCH